MNNTFLQQSYTGLTLNSEDDLMIAKWHTLQSLDLAAKMNHMHYWKHQKVGDQAYLLSLMLSISNKIAENILSCFIFYRMFLGRNLGRNDSLSKINSS